MFGISCLSLSGAVASNQQRSLCDPRGTPGIHGSTRQRCYPIRLAAESGCKVLLFDFSPLKVGLKLKSASGPPFTQLLQLRGSSSEIVHCSSKFSTRVYFTMDVVQSLQCLLTDVTDDTLRTPISIQLRVKYLEPAPLDLARASLSVCPGIMYGDAYRFILSLPVAHGMKNPVWVHFVLDTGAPKSHLSQQVCLVWLYMCMAVNSAAGLGCPRARWLPRIGSHRASPGEGVFVSRQFSFFGYQPARDGYIRGS